MARFVTSAARALALGTMVWWVPVAGCNRSVCRGAELKTVKTAAEEAAAMQRFWQQCRPLSIGGFDNSGARVPFSDPKWPSKLHHIELNGGAGGFEHVVIDPKNVMLMMGE